MLKQDPMQRLPYMPGSWENGKAALMLDKGLFKPHRIRMDASGMEDRI